MTIQKISRLIAYLNTRYIVITNEIEERKQGVKNLNRLFNDKQMKREEVRREIEELSDEISDLTAEKDFLKDMVESLQSWEI